MSQILLFTLVACTGILVQSFAGFAGSLVAMPLFALFLSPKEVVPTYTLMMLVIDVWLVFESRKHVAWRRVTKLLCGGLIGVPIGAYGLKYLPAHILILGISIVTLIFALLLLFKVRLRLGEGTGVQVGVGLISGVLGGSVSQSGPPVVIYGLSRQWDKNAFRTNLLTYFTCLCFISNCCYWYTGLLTQKNLYGAGAAIIPCFMVSMIGVRLKNRVSEEVFRRVILVIIVVIGVVGLFRSSKAVGAPSAPPAAQSSAAAVR